MSDARDAYDAIDRSISVLRASGVPMHIVISALIAQLHNKTSQLDNPEGDIRAAVIRLLKKMKYPDLFTRLIANTYEPETDRGCWVWSGRTDRKGYGFVNMRVKGRPHAVPHRASRVMEELMRGSNEFDLDNDPLGPILFVPRPRLDPDAETIGHLCHTPGCINPDHWVIETRVENTTERNSRYA